MATPPGLPQQIVCTRCSTAAGTRVKKPRAGHRRVSRNVKLCADCLRAMASDLEVIRRQQEAQFDIVLQQHIGVPVNSELAHAS